VQEQKVLLITGEYISVHQDLAEEKAPLITQLVQAGDMVVTKPNVAHTMVFTQDSILLNLVRGEREHENYGEHTLPSIIVDEDLKKILLTNYKKSCRCCGNTRMQKVLSLGMSPLANNLLENVTDKAELFPLEMDYCSECHNCQLSVVVPPSKMFDNYLYVSSTAKSAKRSGKSL
jgi:predicted restriction endonuclease